MRHADYEGFGRYPERTAQKGKSRVQRQPRGVSWTGMRSLGSEAWRKQRGHQDGDQPLVKDR